MEKEIQPSKEVPVLVANRAATVLQKRCAELGEDVSVRIDINEITNTSFNCEMCFSHASDLESYFQFVSNGVAIAVSSQSIAIVRGMELVYANGILNVRQEACSRTPDVGNYAKTISAHSILDKKANPDGQKHFTPKETKEERNRPSQHLTDMLQIEECLDRKRGLFCVARFIRELCRKTLSKESPGFLNQYCSGHLQFITNYIEPLAKAPSEGGLSEFHALCDEQVDLPDIDSVVQSLGFDKPDEFDPSLWLGWAVARHETPAVCLYCTANFLVVPPLAGDVPKPVEGVIRALVASSLMKLKQVEPAIEVVESFLQLLPADYQTVDTMASALNRSSLGQLEVMPRSILIEALAEGLRHSQEQERETILIQAFNRLL